MSDRRRGFTLIELIVVIAIIALLAALLLPAVANLIDDARVSRTAAELKQVKEGSNRYLANVGSYPWNYTTAGVAWGADVGLVNRAAVRASHVNNWKGPYVEQWPVQTAWGGIVGGSGAAGAYCWIADPSGDAWYNNDGIAGNARYIGMNSNMCVFPPQSAARIDGVVDDGALGTGYFRDNGSGGVTLWFYAGEGPYF